MLIKLKKFWANFKYAVQLNRCPVQTEQQAVEAARKRLMAILYPDKY